MLRIALIGYGKWGKNYIRAVESTGFAKVTTLVLRPCSSKWQDPEISSFKLVSDIESLDVDAAIVAVHPIDNVEICCSLFRKNIPVLVEKPLALNLDDVLKIEDCSNKTGIPFMVNYQHLYSNAYQVIHKRCKDEEITSIQSEAGNIGPFRDFSPLWDYAPHDIALALGLFSENPKIDLIRSEYKIPVGENSFEININNTININSRIWNNQLPKTRLFKVTTRNNEYLYDDLVASCKLSINKYPVQIPSGMPLTNSVEVFFNLIQKSKKNTNNLQYIAINNSKVTNILAELDRNAIKI
jgi:UDP-N-acetylglucosamine 3-dehydrogenase